MKTVFMGTPDFAVPTLEALAAAGHDICLVVTQPDAARDRGKKVRYTPVKEKALELGIEVLQPQRIKADEEVIQKLRELAPDVIVVVAYGQMLPKNILDIPKHGCINVHGSLLPRLRGAAPIQRAIIEGDKETGITIMYMEEGMDTGAMLSSRSTPIDRKSAGELHDELSVMGAELLTETLKKVESGQAEPQKQDDALATYAPMIFKKDGKIDFSKKPEEIECLIRGMDPWPGAFADYEGKPLKIWKAEVSKEKNSSEYGTVTGVSDEGIEIAAGGETLIATLIQMPGKKRMKTSDFLKGNTIEKNTVLR